jgi:predicted glycoside hydrolase/deacetylase ChbG (UPF0249 family)
LAQELRIDCGLHLNLSEPFSGPVRAATLRERHERIARFLNASKYAALIYNPLISRDLRYVWQAQVEEFIRLYQCKPSHIDGHQHQHLCSNMLLANVIPRGEKVRPGFFFWPGEKSVLNRLYRYGVNRTLSGRYLSPDYFFALSQSLKEDRWRRIISLARSANVEVMTHPLKQGEYSFLMSDEYLKSINDVQKGTYALL